MTISRLRWGLRLAVFALLFRGGSGWGSPLPPVVRGAVSANGRYLVVSSLDLGEAVDGGRHRIKGQTFEVTTLETSVYPKAWLSAPNAFYIGLGWTVKTKFDEAHLTYWPIVSNEGSTLVLVGVTVGTPRPAVLMIYKRNGVDGELVRSFALEDLWSQSEIYPHGDKRIVFTDASPQWFATGSFLFSEDGNTLIYRRAGGESLLLRLSDGAVAAAPR